MIPIIGPQNLELTTDWYQIQHTNLHYYHPHISQEANKLLKALGRGSFFIVSGFKLGLFKAVVNGKQACIARLSPGIYVQDFTVIDYCFPLRKQDKFIYVKVFDEDDVPLPKQIYKLGSRYYHGVIGDGINATPTYSIIQSLKHTADRTNFRTFYSLRLTDEYGEDGQVIDIPNITIDDYRFPPNDKDPTDPEDPWDPIYNPTDNENPNDDTEEEDDYTTMIARGQAIMWGMVVDGYSV